MATHNVGNVEAKLVVAKSPEQKLVDFLSAEENRPYAAMFYLGGLTRLYEDFDLMQQGISLAEDCLAKGEKVNGGDPATIVREAKAEQKKVKDFIDLVLKACPMEVQIGDPITEETEE